LALWSRLLASRSADDRSTNNRTNNSTNISSIMGRVFQRLDIAIISSAPARRSEFVYKLRTFNSRQPPVTTCVQSNDLTRTLSKYLTACFLADGNDPLKRRRTRQPYNYRRRGCPIFCIFRSFHTFELPLWSTGKLIITTRRVHFYEGVRRSFYASRKAKRMI